MTAHTLPLSAGVLQAVLIVSTISQRDKYSVSFQTCLGSADRCVVCEQSLKRCGRLPWPQIIHSRVHIAAGGRVGRRGRLDARHPAALTARLARALDLLADGHNAGLTVHMSAVAWSV